MMWHFVKTTDGEKKNELFPPNLREKSLRFQQQSKIKCIEEIRRDPLEWNCLSHKNPRFFTNNKMLIFLHKIAPFFTAFAWNTHFFQKTFHWNFFFPIFLREFWFLRKTGFIIDKFSVKNREIKGNKKDGILCENGAKKWGNWRKMKGWEKQTKGIFGYICKITAESSENKATKSQKITSNWKKWIGNFSVKFKETKRKCIFEVNKEKRTVKKFEKEWNCIFWFEWRID